jgi:hypothetical protein
MPKNLDPHNIAARLSKQNHLLLEDLEKQIDISFRERLAALGVIAKIEKDIRELQKEANELDTGTAVRRYSKAFEAKAAGRARALARSRAVAAAGDDDGEADEVD